MVTPEASRQEVEYVPLTPEQVLERVFPRAEWLEAQEQRRRGSFTRHVPVEVVPSIVQAGSTQTQDLEPSLASETSFEILPPDAEVVSGSAGIDESASENGIPNFVDVEAIIRYAPPFLATQTSMERAAKKGRYRLVLTSFAAAVLTAYFASRDSDD